jgi:hypothetical protein
MKTEYKHLGESSQHELLKKKIGKILTSKGYNIEFEKCINGKYIDVYGEKDNMTVAVEAGSFQTKNAGIIRNCCDYLWNQDYGGHGIGKLPSDLNEIKNINVGEPNTKASNSITKSHERNPSEYEKTVKNKNINIGKVRESKVNQVNAVTIPKTIRDITNIKSGYTLEWDWYVTENGDRLPKVVGVKS